VKKSRLATHDYLPLLKPLGSEERFHEFLRLLVLNGGSRKFSSQYAAAGVDHLAPQIGTLLHAQLAEEQPLRRYRVESFHSELQRLADDVGAPQLFDLYRSLGGGDLAPHVTSRDPHGTTQAAKSFLSSASREAFEEIFGSSRDTCEDSPAGENDCRLTCEGSPAGGNGSSSNTCEDNGPSVRRQQSAAKSSLVAICRLYLIDYMCLEYPLPADCRFLQQEFDSSLEAYHARKEFVSREQNTMIAYLRAWLPEWALHIIAVAMCGWRPECQTAVMRGLSVDPDD